jgi:DNA-binding response OmpR family regulator
MTEHPKRLVPSRTIASSLKRSFFVPERVPNGLVVLLLEDESLIAMDMEMTLSSAGFDVSCVMSGAGAQAWLDRRVPDVVVVDIQLSDGHCTAVVSRLIAANIPFVVHSGDQADLYAETPFARGSWLTKPCAPEDLLRVTSALVTQGGRREAAIERIDS